jgi:hypothetical protein
MLVNMYVLESFELNKSKKQLPGGVISSTKTTSWVQCNVGHLVRHRPTPPQLNQPTDDDDNKMQIPHTSPIKL